MVKMKKEPVMIYTSDKEVVKELVGVW